MNYQEALDYIGSVNWKGSRPGLDRIRRLMDMLGNPQNSLKFIHVAGTNGKGSTCIFLSQILKQAGYKTGLFISPFIEVFNERMQINNVNIPDQELADIVDYIRPYADSMEDAPTEFELNTAIAFVYFARHDCDIVVLEVGMGGELDSTNIINAPELAVITTISLDHTQILGDTIEKIALTKSGIIKPGTHVVMYRQSDAVMDIIRARAAAEGASLYISEPEKTEIVSVDIDRQVLFNSEYGNMATVLLGRYQKDNVALVLKAVEVLNEIGYRITVGNVVKGLEETRWPGRFEVISREPVFIVDGGHNPQGIQATADSLESIFQSEKLIIIFGVLADKDYMNMLGTVLPFARELLTVTPPSNRALPAEKTAEIAAAYGVKVKAFDRIDKAIDAAFADAGGTIPICALGSLYMVGDIKKIVRDRQINGKL